MEAPHKAILARAERLAIDAAVERKKQNHVYAGNLEASAFHLRGEALAAKEKEDRSTIMASPIRFTMVREPSRGGATLSKLFLGTEFICDVLEDQVREIPGRPVSEWKVHGATAIPAGTYEIELRQSGRFGPDTMTLLDVPGFQYIRVHSGNYSEDTEGCLLPGVRNSPTTVGQSKVTLARMKAIVVPAIRAGTKVTIQIVPAKEG